MKFLYKYPQTDFCTPARRREPSPYSPGPWNLSSSTRGFSRKNRYFDMFVECAKAPPRNLDSRRGHRPSGRRRTLHLLPTVCFATRGPGDAGRLARSCSGLGKKKKKAKTHARAGSLHAALRGNARAALQRERHEPQTALRHRRRWLVLEGRHQRLRRARSKGGGNPAQRREPRWPGHYRLVVGAGQSTAVRLRLTDGVITEARCRVMPSTASLPLRQGEADEFYSAP